MKHVAAYLLAQLGGNASPDAAVSCHCVAALPTPRLGCSA